MLSCLLPARYLFQGDNNNNNNNNNNDNDNDAQYTNVQYFKQGHL
ncbi:MAG: hypothetical protein ACOCQQ_03375 [Candidatus Nanoarchaeia archaeon]